LTTPHPDQDVPPHPAHQARQFQDSQLSPAATQDAATVVLLREASPGVEVYLLRRHERMAFAAGMSVFPGGTVDRRDFDADIAWAGPSPEHWGTAFRCPPQTAQALLCAAVRETFEESGVLLAGRTPESVVADTTTAEWEHDRVALVERRQSFAEFLRNRRLAMRTDLLRPWAHWITPESEPRRYDTRFFLAALPVGQVTRDVSGEADHVAWLRPAEALTAVDEGRLEMLPPTYRTLRELAGYPSLGAAFASAHNRVISAVLPQVRMVDGRAVLETPGEVDSG
jgi:8-oxo-dGTP pyrophosphatase MutT (NUDIX family)